jgi:hypothetical protein
MVTKGANAGYYNVYTLNLVPPLVSSARMKSKVDFGVRATCQSHFSGGYPCENPSFESGLRNRTIIA